MNQNFQFSLTPPSEWQRRRGDGGLLAFLEKTAKPVEIHYDDEGQRGEFYIRVLLQSTAQLMRGDLESRTVTIKAPKTRRAWKAAWRMARQLALAAPRRIIEVSETDWKEVTSVEIPSHLDGWFQVNPFLIDPKI